MKKAVLLFLFFTYFSRAVAQDMCSDASTIQIGGGGYASGIFYSDTVSLAGATVEASEYFSPVMAGAGLMDRSIWFKFSIPAARKVFVSLDQPGSVILPGNLGFTIYQSTACLPSSSAVYSRFSPIADFGSTGHACVEKGQYLIQVSSNAVTVGEVFIRLAISDTTGSPFDLPGGAQDLGEAPLTDEFIVECQSISNSSEICNLFPTNRSFTKSTWHTFRTPAYFDGLSVMINSADCLFPGGAPAVIGYQLYRGNSRMQPVSTLLPVHDCDTMISNGSFPGLRSYSCDELLPATDYTLRLIHEDSFEGGLRIFIKRNGALPTTAPLPVLSQMGGNNLGELPSVPTGIFSTYSDRFGCNSRHSMSSCAELLPPQGINAFGHTFELSTFFNFHLSNAAKLEISATVPCTTRVLLRLFRQAPGTACSEMDPTNLVSEFLTSSQFGCLAPGDYTVQLSGVDSLQGISVDSGGCFPSDLCIRSAFGSIVTLSFYSESLNFENQFSLSAPGRFGALNTVGGVMQPLANGVAYVSPADTFGCNKTVLPPSASGQHCLQNADKAIYREFVIGDADGDGSADSGIVKLAYDGIYNSTFLNYILYKGDAHALSIVQGVNQFPDTIMGLIPVSECRRISLCDFEKVCVTPGTYTLVTLTDGSYTLPGDNQPVVRFDISRSKYGNPSAPENLGNIIDSLRVIGADTLITDIDIFSCTDNAVPINGFDPPDWNNGHPASKAIYREFYLSEPSSVEICRTLEGCNAGGYVSVFSGRISSGVDSLEVVEMAQGFYSGRCLVNVQCQPLPAGWYTIVSYGTGPSYSDPLKELNEFISQNGSYIGITNRLRIQVFPVCDDPKYNRPFKAAVDSVTGEPFLIEYRHNSGSTASYPITSTIYDLPSENLNCTVDTPFSARPILACNSFMNRVAYYVFRTTQEAYVEIDTYGLWGQVYNLDVRTDSMLFPTTAPIQPCLISKKYIQICKLQPGIYTLVLFAGDDNLINGCGRANASIYIDSVGYSRFDHANNAYDFGVIPADNTFYNGKPGDINPADPSRAPSNDFFFCTTGARNSDPVAPVCDVLVNPLVYNTRLNNALYSLNNLTLQNGSTVRRNLWYTFVADTPGRISIMAINKTIGKDSAYGISVYRSDVSADIPFTQLQSSGGVDSTILQGLELIKTNRYIEDCDSVISLEFNRESCTSPNPERYYVVIDNSNFGWTMQPNHQVELQIRLKPLGSLTAFYDHYSTAADLGPLNLGSLIGPTGNLECATADASDPILLPQFPVCSPRTLWYKFTAFTNGKLLFRLRTDRVVTGNNAFQLLREVIAGDSTDAGLYNLSPYTSDFNDGNGMWNKVCVEPGTYYLLTTGCLPVTGGLVTPEFLLVQDEGDHCNTSVVLPVTGAGNFEVSLTADCHTLGTGFGENGPTLSCPPGGISSEYKSSWFRIDITGTDTLDLEVGINQNTHAPSSLIKHRLINGDCSAMQEHSCVEDAGTLNLYQCMPPGSYYIQVFTPLFFNGMPVQGEITLRVNSVKHNGFCTPAPPCAVSANFSYSFNCSQEDSVRFTNNSSSGVGISYHWNFGFGGQTDTVRSPSFYYPDLPQSQTYIVTLIVINTAPGCGSDTVSLPVTVPPRFSVNLGNDTAVCSATIPFELSVISLPGAVYQWQDGSAGNTFNVTLAGPNVYHVTVTHSGCEVSDTVVVDLVASDSSIANLLLCSSELPYSWNGQVISSAGTYRSLLTSQEGCDSIAVLIVSLAHSPPGPSVTNVGYCQGDVPVPLEATPSLDGYTITWYQSPGGVGVPDPPIPVTGAAGTFLFFASESDGSCESIRVPVTVTVGEAPELGNDRRVEFCEGGYANLAALFDLAGTTANWTLGNNPVTQPENVTLPGIYQLIVSNGICSDTADVEVNMLPGASANAGEDTTVQVNIPFNLNGSGGVFYLWSPPGLLNDPTLADPVAILQGSQAFVLQVTNNAGCSSLDTVLISVLENPGLLMPSAFTPNGDGLNDIFRPLPGKVTRLYYLRVFNRFGQMVFQSFDGGRGWDGNFRGQKQNTGTYVWVLKGMDVEGKIKTLSGTVLLIRDPG